MPFKKLTPASEQVIQAATKLCQQLSHYYVGTEHLAIALLRTPDETLQQAFRDLDISTTWADDLTAQIGVGAGPIDDVINMTPRTIQTAKLSRQIVKQHGHPAAEPAHLFLALLKAGDGIALRFLRSKEIDIEQTRSHLDVLINSLQVNEPLRKLAIHPLAEYGRDLTVLAQQGQIPPVFGRDEEIRDVGRILAQVKKNNPLLIGDAGVGKTSIVDGFARRLLEKEIDASLKNKRIIEISMAKLVSGTNLRGDFEKRLTDIIDEARNDPNIVLFIDEIHTMVGAGDSSGGLDASNILKPALANGDISCIGATTIDEYRKYIEKDEALDRRFQIIKVKEPSTDNALRILEGLRPTYESHYQVMIDDSALHAAVELSERYLIDRHLPDKAIDLIDRACAQSRLQTLAISFDNANMVIDRQAIAAAVAKVTGIPTEQILNQPKDKALQLESNLKQNIKGQDPAITTVAKSLRVAMAGLRDSNKPLSVFLFTGPTGVGKTAMAKALAKHMFDGENAIIRFDMSEYKKSEDIARLIGAPPGYIGHDKGGTLTNAIRRQPYSVVLFDEIEKAHADIYDIFLQLFDEGRLTDSDGKLADFRNAVIIMTSNLGGKPKTENQHGMGFVQEDSKADTPTVDLSQIKDHFRPELINRIDELVVFNALNQSAVSEVIDERINELNNRLAKQGTSLRLSDEARDFLLENGYDAVYGVRGLDRTIRRYLEEPLAELLIENTPSTGTTLTVNLDNNTLVFQ